MTLGLVGYVILNAVNVCFEDGILHITINNWSYIRHMQLWKFPSV
jgi:hypothetical protein